MQCPKFQLKADKYLGCLLAFLQAGAIVIMLVLDILWPLKALLMLALISYSGYLMRLHVLRAAANAIKTCWVDEAGRWHLQTAVGREYQGCLLGDSLITPYITVLNFKVAERRRPLSLCFTCAAIEAKTFRRLRVYLATHYDQTA